MIPLLLHLVLPPSGGHRQLALEDLALRHPVAVYKRTLGRPTRQCTSAGNEESNRISNGYGNLAQAGAASTADGQPGNVVLQVTGSGIVEVADGDGVADADDQCPDSVTAGVAVSGAPATGARTSPRNRSGQAVTGATSTPFIVSIVL